MTTDTQCRAITRKGLRCSKKAATAGFCSLHFPTPEKSTLLESAKTAGEIVTLATGIIEFIKIVIELWRSIPFGPGPEMPDAYDYLVNEFGPSGPRLPDVYKASHFRSTSVDWSQAADLYDFAKHELEFESDGIEQQKEAMDILSGLTEKFIDGLQPEFKERLLKKIGAPD